MCRCISVEKKFVFAELAFFSSAKYKSNVESFITVIVGSTVSLLQNLMKRIMKPVKQFLFFLGILLLF